MSYVFVIASSVWVMCGVLAYAGTLGYFQGRYPTVRDAEGDFMTAMQMAFLGPIGLAVSAFKANCFLRYGLKIIPEGPVKRRSYNA